MPVRGVIKVSREKFEPEPGLKLELEPPDL